MNHTPSLPSWVLACAFLPVFLGTTYKTIVIDGSNDFATDETLSGTSGSTWYVTWDADNIYLGAANVDIGNSPSSTKWLLWYIDTDPQPVPTGGSGTITGQTYNTQQPTLPFTANYHLRWKTDDTYINLQMFNGSAWVSASGTGIEHSRVGSFVEIKIPRANLGSPASMYLCADMIDEKPAAEWTYYLLPSLHTDGYDVNFTHYYSFPLDAGRAPDDPANLDAPLPIQLAGFTAAVRAPGCVRLEWATLSEVNNYGFEVQRSQGGAGTFESLPQSFVPGHGTTLQRQEYSYADTTPVSGIASYRLKQIDLDGAFHFTDAVCVRAEAAVGNEEFPSGFSLRQNYPNPFNPSTTIRYGLPAGSQVELTVFNTAGQKIASLVNERQEAGYHEVRFDGAGLSSGVYFYRLTAGSFVQIRTMTFLK